MWTKRTYLVLGILWAILIAGAQSATAQYPSDAERFLLEIGSPAFNTPDSVPNGFVNLANGNLHIEIPIISYPQRGGIPFVAKMVYDSRIWKITDTGSALIWTATNVPNNWEQGGWENRAGWRLKSTDRDANDNLILKDAVLKSCVQGATTYYRYETSNYRHVDLSGTQHKFPIYHETTVPCYTPTSTTNSGPSLDGSGLWMNLTSDTSTNNVKEVIAPDGTKVFNHPTYGGPGWMRDANGNYMDRSGDFYDTLNRIIPVSITYPAAATVDYNVPTTIGTGVYRLIFGSVTVTSTDFGLEIVGEGAGTLTPLTSLVLPDGTSYSFTYDSHGLLASMTLPTGAMISFTHTNTTGLYGGVNRHVSSVVVDGGTTTYTAAACGTNCNKMTVHQPNGDETEYRFNINRGAWLTQTKTYTGSVASGTLHQTVNVDYDSSSTSSALGSTAFTRPIRTTATLPGPGSDLIKKSELVWETFSYDYRGTNYTGTRGNVTTAKEFAFGSGAVGAEYRRTVNTYLHTGNSNYLSRNIVIRITNTQLQKPDGTKLTETITAYDGSTLTNVTSVTHHDTTNYGTGFSYRGNPTSFQVWTGGSNYLTTAVEYDITGQVRKITNPKGNDTTYSYTDSFFTDNLTSSPSAYSPTPPTTNAYVTSSTSPVSGTATVGYYYKTGSLAKSTDINNNTAVTSYYNEPMGRPVRTWTPTGAITSGSYPSAIQVNITTPTATAQANFTTLGQLKDTKLTNDPQGTVTTETTYDTLGRVLTKKNPFRSVLDATYGVTTYEYDGLNRVKKVTLPDNMAQFSYYGAGMSTGGGRTTQLCSTSTYGYGYPTLAKDEAGKKRQSWTDAFGRLIEADEPDSSGSLTLGTCYKYDVHNNLKEVNQGVQTRTNTYENDGSGNTIGLGRLITEVTPEGGTVNLYYTTSGGVLCAANPSVICRGTDARSITTTYTYDAEDRLVSKSYSNSDPTVTYYYDYNCLNSSGSFVNDGTCSGGLQLTNGKGRRVGMSDGSGLSAWKYNILGQVLTLRRKIGTIAKDFTYTYGSDGTLYNAYYPSGYGIIYSYRADGKLSRIAAGSLYHAENLNYAPHGALSTYTMGWTSSGFAGIAMSSTYNNRLQPVNMTAKHTSNTVTLMDYTYSFVASSINDGHVKSVTNNITSQAGRSQTYTYDEMNRLASAQTTGSTAPNCWGLSYQYDRYANLHTANVTKCSANGISLTIDSTTNKILNSGFSYDTAGNLTADGVSNFTWNAEGRMAATAGVNYTYNGDGQRVKKAAGSPSQYDKLYWYGLGGEVLAESDLSGNLTSEYIFMGGTRIARRDVSSGNVYYFLGDRLGNARIVTNSTGGIVEETDFLPYGTERTIYNDSTVTDNTYKFTGHERDGESGLDHTLHRQHSSTLGRWLSPDRVRGNPYLPQTWNRYSYTASNPMNRVDPNGAAWYDIFGDLFSLIGSIPFFDPDSFTRSNGACLTFDSTGHFAAVHSVGCGLIVGIPYLGPAIPHIVNSWSWNPTLNQAMGQIPIDQDGLNELLQAGFFGGATLPLCTLAGPGALACVIVSAAGNVIAIMVSTGILAEIGTYIINQMKNTQANKAFKDAVDAYERRCGGKPLSEDDKRRLHDTITGEDSSFHDIIESAVALFGCKNEQGNGE
jgi:RHS repeat-associated protein